LQCARACPLWASSGRIDIFISLYVEGARGFVILPVIRRGLTCRVEQQREGKNPCGQLL
jgi:hypothetical protein